MGLPLHTHALSLSTFRLDVLLRTDQGSTIRYSVLDTGIRATEAAAHKRDALTPTLDPASVPALGNRAVAVQRLIIKSIGGAEA